MCKVGTQYSRKLYHRFVVKQCGPYSDKEEEDKQALRHDRDPVSLGACVQKGKFRAEDRPGGPSSAMAD